MSESEDPLYIPYKVTKGKRSTRKRKVKPNLIDVNRCVNKKKQVNVEDNDIQNVVRTRSKLKEAQANEIKKSAEIIEEVYSSDEERTKKPHRRKLDKTKDRLLKKKRRFCCNQCDFKSKFFLAVKVHIATHNEEKRYKCNKCVYKTKFSDSLRRHIASQHEYREKNLFCNQCDYRTEHDWNLKSHMKRHSKERCTKCRRKFDREVMFAHLAYCASNIFVPNGDALVPNGNVCMDLVRDRNALVLDSADSVFVPMCELVEGDGVVSCGPTD